MITEEKKLGLWISTQNNNYKKKIHSMKNESKKIILDEINEKYKELMMNFDSVWNENYINLRNFFEEKQKKTSSKSKNIDEKKIAVWLSHQKGIFPKKKKDESK